MPGRLRAELEAAVLEHRREHGSRHYELLRDDPRFAPWTGTHLGDRGEKYFDRVVALVKRALARKARLKRRHLAEDDAALARPFETNAADVAKTPLSPADTNVAFSDLLGDLCEQRLTLRAELAACLDDDGSIVDGKRYYRALPELVRVNKGIADLSKQFGALKAGEGADALLGLLLKKFDDQPERVDALIAEFNDLIRHQSGLAAQSGANQ